ncbi:MAG: DUF1360 domain-containing protein [Acidimicrobiales bacterium]
MTDERDDRDQGDGRASDRRPAGGDGRGEREGDRRAMGAYAAMLGIYGAGALATTAVLRRRRDRVRRPGPMDLALLGLATQHLTRLITKDTVTAPLRAPFTQFEGPAGEGEVNEQVVGTGVRHVVGELVSCPFCLGQWVATGLVAANVGAPSFGMAATTVLTTAQLSDYLQLAYAAFRHRQ